MGWECGGCVTTGVGGVVVVCDSGVVRVGCDSGVGRREGDVANLWCRL